MKIARYLTDEQKTRILSRNYRFDGGFLVTADIHQVGPLEAGLGLIYTPHAYEIAHMLGGTWPVREAVDQFIRAADGGQILCHEDMMAALGVTA